MTLRQITCPVEKLVAVALKTAGVEFRHESEQPGQRLDFYLPAYGVYIECKAFATPRLHNQIDGQKVIVIQSKEAAMAFSHMLREA